MGRFGARPKNRLTNDKPCDFCNEQKWNATHKCPALDKLCNNCGKKGHFARVFRQKQSYKGKVRNVTEEKTTATETEPSLYRIERINRITDRNTYLKTKVKINGI